MKNLVLGNYLILYITNPLVNNLRAAELFFHNPLVSTNLTNVFFVQITATLSNLIRQKGVSVSISPLLIYIGILYKSYFFISIED